jgi:hypothetical protein
VLSEIGVRRVDAIKIDVEGAELSVLRGCARTLDANPEVLIFLDLHPQLGVDVLEVADFLAGRGLGFFRLDPPWNVPLAPSNSLAEALVRPATVAAGGGFA